MILTISSKIKNFFAQFCSVSNKEYVGQNIGFMSIRERKYATLLSHREQRQVISFSNLTELPPHNQIYIVKVHFR